MLCPTTTVSRPRFVQHVFSASVGCCGVCCGVCVVLSSFLLQVVLRLVAAWPLQVRNELCVAKMAAVRVEREIIPRTEPN